MNLLLIWRLSAYFLNANAQFWILLIFSFDLVTVQVMTYILSESIFSTLLLLGLNGLAYLKFVRISCWVALLTGVAFGLFALTRPVGQFLPWLLVAWLLINNQTNTNWRAKLLAAVLILLCSIGVLELWKQRMLEQTGHRFISTTTSINMYNYRAAWNIARKEGRTFQEVKEEFQKNRNAFVNANPELDAYQVAQHFTKEGLSIIIDTPWQTIEQGMRGLVFLYGGIYNASIDRFFKKPWLANLIKLFSYAYWLFVYIGILMCLVFIKRFKTREYEMIALTVICIGYFTFFSAAVEAYARLRMPFAPYLIMLSVLGWLMFSHRRGRV